MINLMEVYQTGYLQESPTLVEANPPRDSSTEIPTLESPRFGSPPGYPGPSAVFQRRAVNLADALASGLPQISRMWN